METLEALRRKLDSARDLAAITRAMKALAAVRIRQSREAVASNAEYQRTIEQALQVLLRNRPPGLVLPAVEAGRRVGAVVIGSDLGLAGRFNQRIVDFALDRLAEIGAAREDRVVVTVGQRVAAILGRESQDIAASFRMTDSVEAIAPLVQDLTVALEALWGGAKLDGVVLFYNHYHSGLSCRPHLAHLLPVNPEWLAGLERQRWPTPALPTFRGDWDRLFSEVVREHLFLSLFRAVAESFASENASRLGAMQAAERRIREREKTLGMRFNQKRQERITSELLDLVTGYRAVLESSAYRTDPHSARGPARHALPETGVSGQT